MRPLTDLLVRPLAQAHPRLNITHIPHRDPSDPFGLAKIYHFARRLVEEVALLPGECGAHLGCTPVESLGAS
jgi:hypothetical protein